MPGATILDQVISFVGVAAGATVALPHGINVRGTQVIPDFAFQDNGNFTILSCTATILTVRNDSLVVATLNVYLWKRHTIERDYGSVLINNLIPQPFIPSAAGAGGGSSGTGDPQEFRYVATGAETGDFVLILPAARLNTNYNATVRGGGMTFELAFDVIVADNTLTTIHVISTNVLTAGDVLLITVRDLT